MADKPNPFLKLMADIKKDVVKPTPKVEEKNISDSAPRDLTAPDKSAMGISPMPEEKASLPERTPNNMLLLAAANDEPQPIESDGQVPALRPSSVEELGFMDTESMEPKTVREGNLNVKAAELGKTWQLDSTQSVREVCDRIDKMIGDEAGANVQGPDLITIRNYVQAIMVTLKTRPEFDSVIIDKDVRNVMKFVRATRQETLELRDIKVQKKAVRAANKEVKAAKGKEKQFSGFDKAFNAVMFGPGGGK